MGDEVHVLFCPTKGRNAVAELKPNRGVEPLSLTLWVIVL